MFNNQAKATIWCDMTELTLMFNGESAIKIDKFIIIYKHVYLGALFLECATPHVGGHDFVLQQCRTWQPKLQLVCILLNV